MSDDDKAVEIVKAVGTVAVAAMDPTGGVLTAAASHAMTNWSIASKLRKGNLDFWIETLIENDGERRKQYEETQDEFHRHKLTLEWLMDELAEHLGRIETLETIALGLMAQSDEMLRARPDPEMRPYLVNAFRNAVENRERFTPTWVGKLFVLLDDLGADHLRMLCEFRRTSTAYQGQHRPDLRSCEGQIPTEPATQAIWSDLQDQKLIGPYGSGGRKITIVYLGLRLADFVTDPDELRKRGPDF